MRNAYLIAAGAGFVSAMAFLSAMMGSPVTSFFLFLIAALPLYVAGVGWTWAAALLASAVGSLLLIAFGAREAAMVYAGLLGMPAVLLTQLAEQRRVAQSAGDGTTAVMVRWASPGIIVLMAAALATIISVTFVSLLHDNMPAVRDEVTKLVQNTPQIAGDQQLSQEQIAQIADMVVALVPAAAAIVPMMCALLNLWLAGRITLAAGQLRRPWPDLPAMRFPRGTPLILATAAFASSTLTGLGGMIAVAVFGAIFIAYLLLGLAVIHYLTRGKSWRAFALSGIYVGLFLVNVWLALPIILLGLADTVLSLRKPSQPGSGST
jgi:hypothetical protein